MKQSKQNIFWPCSNCRALTFLKAHHSAQSAAVGRAQRLFLCVNHKTTHCYFVHYMKNAHRKDVFVVQPVSYQPPFVCWVSGTKTSHWKGECFWTETAAVRRVEGAEAGMEALQGRRDSHFMTNLWQQRCEIKKKENDYVLFAVQKWSKLILCDIIYSGLYSGYYIPLVKAVVGILFDDGF